MFWELSKEPILFCWINFKWKRCEHNAPLRQKAWNTYKVLTPILVAETTVTTTECSTFRVGMQLTNFTANGCVSLQMFSTHTAESLFLPCWTKAMGDRDPHQRRGHTWTRSPHSLQALLMAHKVTYFTNESDKTPYEITAVVAERWFGESHFPKTMSGCTDMVPWARPRGLLCLFPPGQGACAWAFHDGILILRSSAVCHRNCAPQGSCKMNT